MTTTQILTLTDRTGLPQRVATLALTPGLHLARGHRDRL